MTNNNYLNKQHRTFWFYIFQKCYILTLNNLEKFLMRIF
jgi:hypothetical protein